MKKKERTSPSQFKKILFILDVKVNNFLELVFYFCCLSAMDLVGISIVGFYASTLSNTKKNLEIYNFKFDIENQNELFIFFSLTLICIFVIKFIISLFVNYKIINFVELKLNEIRRRLICEFIDSDYSKLIKKNSANYVQNIYPMASQFTSGTVLSGIKAISDMIICISISIYLIITNPIAIFLLISILIISLFAYEIFIKNKLVYFGNEINKEGAQLVKIINEIFHGFKEIKVFDAKKEFLNKYDLCGDNLTNLNSKSSTISILPRYLIELIFIIFLVCYATLSLAIFNRKNDIFVDLSILAFAALRLLPSLNSISFALSQYRLNTNSVNEIYESLNFQNKENVIDCLVSTPLNQLNSITLKDIAYKYDDKEILKKVSLTINKGDVIGITGPSGSGKSTLLNIISGFLRPSLGSTYINQQKYLLNNSEYLKKIAIVSQKSFMPTGSIKYAISFKSHGHSAIENDKVITSLKLANLNEEILNTKLSIETFLEEGGNNFSGGQIQRLALARAFYFERELLLLDEPTSSLDPKSQHEILEAIKLLKDKFTMIIVSHSPDVLSYCDTIYILKNGELNKS